jgi:acetyltransferase-like isoleucine patch superfamily enzyme
VVDQIAIGAGSVIGAGSIVTRDIPAGVIAYGNPAKVVREVQVL